MIESLDPNSGSNRPDYYQVMGISPNASRMEIKEAYLRLKSTYSQNSAALYSLISEEEAKATLQQIEDAYAILEDDYKRQSYNQERGLGAAEAFANSMVGSGTDEDQPEKKVVTTSRSTLPVIKTVAGAAADKKLQEDFQALIDSSDPGNGDLYRQLRELAGVSQAELQSRTKISLEYLQAIETNRFERLPQVVFVKGFLRSYFRYLVVPHRETLVEAFAKRLTAWQNEQKN